jgi:hypothetical protein
VPSEQKKTTYLLKRGCRKTFNAFIGAERFYTSENLVCETSWRVKVLVAVVILGLLVSIKGTLAISDPPPLNVSQDSSTAYL